MKPKRKYTPYIRRANGKEYAEDFRTAFRLAFYQGLNKPYYVMVQHGGGNCAMMVGPSKTDIKQQILIVKVRRSSYRKWLAQIKPTVNKCYPKNHGSTIKKSIMKLKKYVITVSLNFMKDHTRAGDPTNFDTKILEKSKIHTCRAGAYWKKVVKEVNAGRAILSVRHWIGKPYGSKQKEICVFTKLGWQDLKITASYDFENRVFIDNKQVYNSEIAELAKNDGLDLLDFASWFKWGIEDFEGGIIHFTDFRYNPTGTSFETLLGDYELRKLQWKYQVKQYADTLNYPVDLEDWEAWKDYFNMGYGPEDAIREDISCLE